jgi:hypothetical protein
MTRVGEARLAAVSWAFRGHHCTTARCFGVSLQATFRGRANMRRRGEPRPCCSVLASFPSSSLVWFAHVSALRFVRFCLCLRNSSTIFAPSLASCLVQLASTARVAHFAKHFVLHPQPVSCHRSIHLHFLIGWTRARDLISSLMAPLLLVFFRRLFRKTFGTLCRFRLTDADSCGFTTGQLLFHGRVFRYRRLGPTVRARRLLATRRSNREGWRPRGRSGDH